MLIGNAAGIAWFALFFLMIAVTKWLSGLWSCVLTLIVLLVAALAGSSMGLVIADVAEQTADKENDMRFAVGFAASWIVFLVVFLALRLSVEIASRHRVKFDLVTELIGRTVVSLAIAVCFMGFTLYTFHTAPLPNENLWLDAAGARSRSPFGIGLDQFWSGIVSHASWTSLSENATMGRLVSKGYPVVQDSSGRRYYEILKTRNSQIVGNIVASGGVFIPQAIPYDVYADHFAKLREDLEGYTNERPDKLPEALDAPFRWERYIAEERLP